MRFCAYILLVVLTLQSLYISMVAVEYQIHLSEYIAKCMNKDQVQLHCNGQCVLMKKIEEKEKDETKQTLVSYEYSTLYVHKEYTVFAMGQPDETRSPKLLSPYTAGYGFNYHASVFRPPIA